MSVGGQQGWLISTTTQAK